LVLSLPLPIPLEEKHLLTFESLISLWYVFYAGQYTKNSGAAGVEFDEWEDKYD
jgi:hypothetical protein